MNSVKIRNHLVSMLNQYAHEMKVKFPWPVYDQIIDTIMKYYFFADVSYDFDEARATFERFLKTDVLQFKPV